MKYTIRKKEEGRRVAQVEISLEELPKNANIESEKVIRSLAERSIRTISQESNEEIIGKPKVKVLQQEAGKPLKLEIEFYVLPAVQLPDYRRIAQSVKKRKIEVSEKEVEETLKWIQRSRAKFSQKEGPCQEKDLVQIVYSSPSFNQGQEIKDQFIIGEGYLVKEFEEEVKGMKTGEEKEIQVTIPPNHIWQEIAGKKVVFKIKVVSVQKVELPEINDKWAQSLGKFSDLKELRSSIREGILKEKEEIESQRVQNEILEKIASRSLVEIPKILIDLELQHLLQEMKKNIPQMFSITFEDYLERIGMNEEELKNTLMSEVKKKIKKYLVLRAIKKQEKIEASEDEIKEEANKFLAQFKTPQEAEEVMSPQDLINYLKEKIENKKTLQFLENLVQD